VSLHTVTCPTTSVLPSGSGELRCCHTSRDTSSHLLTRSSSGAATCPMVSAPAFQLRADRMPPRVPWCQLPPPSSDAATCPGAPTLASRLKTARVSSRVPQHYVDHELSKYMNIPQWNYNRNIISRRVCIFQDATR
jgi:hypothetical protein